MSSRPPARPNAAVAIDTWHMAKLGIQPDELRRIPPGLLGWVELSDGQYRNLPDPVDETINHRALPGEGEFPIREYVTAARDAGYEGPWGVEVLSAELRALPIERIFDQRLRDERRAAPSSRACSPPAAGRIRRPHRLDVGHRTDDRADLGLQMPLDGRLLCAPVLLAPDESHLGARLGEL